MGERPADAMSRLVVIGEAPGHEPYVIKSLAVMGNTGRNLADIAGWPWGRYVAQTDRRNLFDTPQAAWDTRAAAESAQRIEATLRQCQVLLLGVRVAHAFSYDDVGNYEWEQRGRILFARIPHPSGRNRMWNDPMERARAYKFLHGLI